jgi:hypothetical protein
MSPQVPYANRTSISPYRSYIDPTLGKSRPLTLPIEVQIMIWEATYPSHTKNTQVSTESLQASWLKCQQIYYFSN